ncbi:transcriptional regulator domain-containing protein [Paremcibacter congregatus]|nr:DUF6499 domain-containing protein [Paremcibacter congregatus]
MTDKEDTDINQYAELDGKKPSVWVWEFLKRNPNYRKPEAENN